jgi:hypothetical protein
MMLMTTLNNIARAAALPFRRLSVVFALLMFWLLIGLASYAGIWGAWLAIIIVPALFRYLTNLVETVGRQREPEPPGAEFFRWIGDHWSLFPALVVIVLAWVSYGLYESGDIVAMQALIVIVGFLYPAILGVLAVTHSPLQSLNPVALKRFIVRLGPLYLIAPGYLALIVYLTLWAQSSTFLLALLVEIALLFSLHAVIGALMAPLGIFDDVYLPDSIETDGEDVEGDIEEARAQVLSHAYGFLSRGNRSGGLNHIMEWIDNDRDPEAAWAWYFNAMLGWEDQGHALFFAQQYIHELFRHGETTTALKIIMRCQLINERFKPLWEDLPLAIENAESTGNMELASVLKRR